MDTTQLIRNISGKTGYNLLDSKAFLDCFVEIIQESVDRRESIKIANFGTLDFSTVKERTVKNFKNLGEDKVFPSVETVFFRLSKKLKERLKDT